MPSSRELNIMTARFLREARRIDPERYQEVAKRNPVLSTWQIDSRLRHERPLDADGEQSDARVSYTDGAAYQDWLDAVSKEWTA